MNVKHDVRELDRERRQVSMCWLKPVIYWRKINIILRSIMAFPP